MFLNREYDGSRGVHRAYRLGSGFGGGMRSNECPSSFLNDTTKVASHHNTDRLLKLPLLGGN